MKQRFITHITCWLLCICFATLFGGCSKSKQTSTSPQSQSSDPTTAVDSMRQLVMTVRGSARLYVTEMQIHKLVTHTDEPVLKGKVLGMPVNVPTRIGKRRVLIPIDVTLKAYINFEEFSEANVERTDSSLIITLPDPHVIVSASKVDNQGTRQFVDLARSRYTDADIVNFAKQGEDSIVSHMSQYGIEEEAQRSAARQLLPILLRMGYKEQQVMVRFRKTFTDNDFYIITTKQ